eukprot:TRINITY_DN55257_c0_g1_i2.p1 TRINITY_DN55257_c0_g1~~TRINITY_DN55257_c0_g1_i2.p1  ORF type:complete len:243 (+),score=25.84 TRINITY_DN55257_c0_g1_i2:177-905(+)
MDPTVMSVLNASFGMPPQAAPLGAVPEDPSASRAPGHCPAGHALTGYILEVSGLFSCAPSHGCKVEPAPVRSFQFHSPATAGGIPAGELAFCCRACRFGVCGACYGRECEDRHPDDLLKTVPILQGTPHRMQSARELFDQSFRNAIQHELVQEAGSRQGFDRRGMFGGFGHVDPADVAARLDQRWAALPDAEAQALQRQDAERFRRELALLERGEISQGQRDQIEAAVADRLITHQSCWLTD